MRIYDEIREILALQDARLSNLIGVQSGGRSPRYYHAIFLAFYELIYRENLRVKDREAVVGRLRGTAKTALKIPSGSGNWTGESKRSTIDAVKGVIRSAFEKAEDNDDLSRYSWASEFETLLSNSLVEQQMFDCKQGFVTLGETREFDKLSFEKICYTLSAMANMGPKSVGHIVVGVADSSDDANRIQSLDSVSPVRFRGYRIVGIEREAKVLSKSFNDYWTWLNQKIQDNAAMDRSLAAFIATNSRIVNYYGRAVAVFRVEGQLQPVFYDARMYERSGSETKVVSREDYMRVYQRFAR